MKTKVELAVPADDVPVVLEYLVENEIVSKLLLRTICRLEKNDFDGAASAGNALDQVGAPHTAFQEAELFSRIGGEQLLTTTTRELYAAHWTTVLAVKKLLDNPHPDELMKREIIVGLKTGVRHTARCASLSGLLAALPLPEKAASLSKLRTLRRQGRRWTDRLH